MGVQATVHVDDLSGHIAALIGSKVNTHISDIFRTSVTIHHDIAQENILKYLRYICLVLRGNDQAGTHTVASDILLAVLGCC